jgi:AcrR family transcriptional regulator
MIRRMPPVRRRHYSGGTLRFVKQAFRVPIEMTAPTTQPVQLSNRPKRADALRNYEKLVAAGREAFTEADRSASLEDIARRAGVGIGTLYRHFPTRTDLVQAIYVDEVEALARSAEELADAEPPWEALTAWLHNFLGYVATKQALAEELFAVDDPERQAVFAGCRNMLYGAGEPLLRRAQDAGIVRPDVTIADVIRLVGGIAKMPADDPEDTRRVLAIAVDGLRYRAG